ncbi:MAG: DUF3987 domain-containing protein, partial [Desulfobacterales bacterium]|nr:DUF3987 domain-containing protein [Desulfobacterales bacterium]
MESENQDKKLKVVLETEKIHGSLEKAILSDLDLEQAQYFANANQKKEYEEKERFEQKQDNNSESYKPEVLKKISEDVLKECSTPCESFDTSKLPKILSEYIDEIAKSTDAEKIIITQSVLCTISAYLKHKVYLSEDEYFQRLYPNIWCLSITDSGQYKTTALDKGSRIAFEVLEDIKRKEEEILKKYPINKRDDEYQNEISNNEKRNILLPNRVTAEALLGKLSQGFGGMIKTSEFGDWLKMLDQNYNKTLKPLLTDLFDVPPYYQYSTKTGGNLKIEYPFITINSVSTVDWIKEEIKDTDITSGFFARFLIFLPPIKEKIPPALPEHQIKNYTDTKEIKQILDSSSITKINNKIYRLSEDAKKLFKKIHEKIYEEIKEYEESKKIIIPYVKRWSPYLFKISMLIQPFIDKDTDFISEDAIIGSTSIIQQAIASTKFLLKEELGISDHQKKCQKLLKYIATRGGKIERYKLLASKQLGGGKKDYDYIIESLIETNRIGTIKGNEQKNDVYFLYK